MSIVDPPMLSEQDVAVQPVVRPLTAADLEAFPCELPSGWPVDYELDNGRLVLIMAPPGDVHGAAQSNVAAYLKMHGEHKGHGKARTETGLILWQNPDRVVTPDVMFAAKKSLPLRISPEGYWLTIPELVVEVRSKNDSMKYVERKIEHYLKAGVEIVWVVDPTTRTVAIHTASGSPLVRGQEDVLELPGLITGFSLPVTDVFRD
jgi:Uma2 family endonuclease